ncbi:MAG TPA: COX15/CtaA family protein [Verrucomicrobiota bacterium]|nr:COX15/CtaA family protein [Verrucomicrobiota bacterium]
MDSRPSRTQFVFAVLTATATLGLICMGGLVTSKGVGMAVPDWPTSFGYNMFALPVQQWFHGGVFDEHTHRLWASSVGVLVVFLTRWLGGGRSRKQFAAIGMTEIIGGLVLLSLGPDWRGAGHFLAGIGGVVLLAALVWAGNPPAPGMLPRLGWIAFWLVQVQGLLGGLRVVLDKVMVGHLTLGTLLGLAHGCLGQAFFVVLAVIALLLSPWWGNLKGTLANRVTSRLQTWIWVGTALIVVQLLLGATMRHQHAGLAISDFPKAYGQWWPDTDLDSVARYNRLRTHDSTVTQAQIQLQMLHRLGAVAAAATILGTWFLAWRTAGNASPLTLLAMLWGCLVIGQFTLGMWTIWSNKAADIATAHVAGGAMLLGVGTWLILVSGKLSLPASATPRAVPLATFARPVTR